MTNAPGHDDDLPQDSSGRRARTTAKLRVLAVDDDTSILQLLKTALSAFNYEISIANSGANAMSLIERQEKPFDCLLLDIQMPEMSGLQVCREVRKLPDYRDAPILMLTAMSDRHYVEEAFVAGATDYVTKPFDFLELRSRMSAAQRLVQERRKARESVEVAKQLKQELDTNLQFGLDDPIAIVGIDRVLRYTEFDNYIMQLSQGKLFNSYSAAIKVADAAKHHAEMTSSEFRRSLYDVAAAIAELTKKAGAIISYRGNGAFLCVFHGRVATQQAPEEEQLNQFIATLQAQRQAKSRCEVILGEMISLRSLSKSGALMAVNSALESVERRVSPGEQGGAPSDHEARADSIQAKKRGYENVLRDLFREEPSLRSN